MPKTFLVSYKPFGVSTTWISYNVYELAPFRHILVVQRLKMSGLAGACYSVSVQDVWDRQISPLEGLE